MKNKHRLPMRIEHASWVIDAIKKSDREIATLMAEFGRSLSSAQL